MFVRNNPNNFTLTDFKVVHRAVNSRHVDFGSKEKYYIINAYLQQNKIYMKTSIVIKA